MGLFDIFKPKRAQAHPETKPTKATSEIPDNAREHVRTAWLWHTEAGESEARATHLGGHPIMGTNEAWPACRSCEQPLSLLMQCDLDALPDRAGDHGGGLLRQFYCEHDACVGMGGWEAFDPQHHLSILRTAGKLRAAPDGTKVHPHLTVTQWEAAEDLPHWEDIEIEGFENFEFPLQGHKFGGWPAWYQGPERPNCPDCNAVMEPFIQFEEAPDTGFNFGGGTGHVSQCATHRDQLAFAWACG